MTTIIIYGIENKLNDTQIKGKMRDNIILSTKNKLNDREMKLYSIHTKATQVHNTNRRVLQK